MKKTILLMLLWTCCAAMANAQTWTGAVSTDWNTAGNWNPATVPTATADIYIPGTGITNWPKFAFATTANNFTMYAGSIIDVDGFALTVNGPINIAGAVFNNSNAATDISINTAGANSVFIGGSTFNDAVIYTHGSSGPLYESYSNVNHYTSNLTMNLSSTADLHFGYSGASAIDGNLTVKRTVAGTTSMFENGAVIGGNFTYTNNIGGDSYIGGNALARINGTVNLASNFSSVSPNYTLVLVKNQTTGGAINIQNAGYIRFTSDTLKLNTCGVTGFKNASINDFNGNDIAVTTITLSDNSATNNTIYFRNNHFTGNSIINFNGGGDFYESYGGRNLFTGNVTYNIPGTGFLHHGYENQPTSAITGNLSVNRTGVGTTELLRGGGSVGGNFSYVNNAAGSSTIGNTNYKLTVNGNVTLTSDFGTNTHGYNLQRIINQSAGGAVNIQHPYFMLMSSDTLKASSISITGVQNGTVSDFINNDLTGNFTLSDDATTGSYTYLRGNKITGTAIINRNGNQSMYEGYSYPNIYIGNTTFNISGSGDLISSYTARSIYNGNLTINRTADGTTTLFGSQGAAITGNFMLSSTAGGNIYLGNSDPVAGAVNINGTVNITGNGLPGTQGFYIEHLINQTNGGMINIIDPAFVKITIDTLKVVSVNISGVRNGAISDIRGNQLDGSLTFSDDAAAGSYFYFRANTLLGDVTINRNGPQAMYESYQGANRYVGNFTLNQNADNLISLAYTDSSVFAKDVTLKVNTNLSFANKIKMTGAANSTLKQTGTAPLLIATFEMAKTGAGKLILNTPLTVSGTLLFNGGNIQSSTANSLNFTNDAIHTGLSVSSHVTGPVSKTGSNAFTFPIGNDASLDTVSMTAPAFNTDKFTAQYFYGNAAANGYDTAQRAANLKRVSGCEYWDVKRDAGSSNVSLTFGYSGLCTTGGYYITDPTKISVAHWNGTLWEDLGNGGASGIPNGAIKTAAAVSNFSPFAIASTDLTANVLPVKLISFAGVKQNGKVMLQWLTENETALASFEVEKSLDGIRFQRIATVNALNNTGRNNYRNVDNEPAKGYNFYRLRQIDINGKFSYSNVVKVDFSDNTPISISPNPATNAVVVTDATVGDVVRIINSLGQVVATLKITATNKLLDVSKLSSGVYTLQLASDKTTRVAQFVKQ